MKVVAHAPEIVVDRLVGIIVAMDTAIGNDVQPSLLLIEFAEAVEIRMVASRQGI